MVARDVGGMKWQVRPPYIEPSHMTLLIQMVAVLIYQQNHMTWLSMMMRDKTVAMIPPDINGNISTENEYYYIILVSD